MTFVFFPVMRRAGNILALFPSFSKIVLDSSGQTGGSFLLQYGWSCLLDKISDGASSFSSVLIKGDLPSAALFLFPDNDCLGEMGEHPYLFPSYSIVWISDPIPTNGTCFDFPSHLSLLNCPQVNGSLDDRILNVPHSLFADHAEEAETHPDAFPPFSLHFQDSRRIQVPIAYSSRSTRHLFISWRNRDLPLSTDVHKPSPWLTGRGVASFYTIQDFWDRMISISRHALGPS